MSNTTAQNTFPATGSAGIGTNAPNASSLLEMLSTSKGLLIPRMTKTQRDAIATPATGLMIYQTNSTPGFYYYSGTAWTAISAKGANATLSNLAAITAVNVSLLPGTTNARDLGSSSFAWKDMYLNGGLYFNGIKMMQYKAGVNTLVGENTGSAGTGGYNSTFGSNVLSNNTTGNSNVAIGENSLVYNTTGSNNTATGYAALINNTNGYNNSAFGFQSLYNNTEGFYNSADGYQSLYNTNMGSYNTAKGAFAGFSITTGNNNTLIGMEAGYKTTTGEGNVFIGRRAGLSNVAGSFNTMIGSYAGFTSAQGNNNTLVGVGTNIYTAANNSTAIGYNAQITNDNTIILGGTDVNAAKVGIGTSNPQYLLEVVPPSLNNTYNGIKGKGKGGIGVWGETDNRFGYAILGVNTAYELESPYGYAGYFIGASYASDGFYTPSDSILKKNVTPVKNMIEKIMNLQSSSYFFRDDIPGMHLPHGKQYGFIAQNLEKEFPQLINETHSIATEKESSITFKAVNYTGLIPVLVAAIQELVIENKKIKTTVENKQIAIDNLQKQIDELKALFKSTQPNTTKQAANTSSASLKQNTPNPYSQATIIDYSLPVKFGSAKIIITDNNGKTVKQFSLNGSGKGAVSVTAGSLAAGMYHYSLYVDNKFIDSKKMEIQR